MITRYGSSARIPTAEAVYSATSLYRSHRLLSNPFAAATARLSRRRTSEIWSCGIWPNWTTFNCTENDSASTWISTSSTAMSISATPSFLVLCGRRAAESAQSAWRRRAAPARASSTLAGAHQISPQGRPLRQLCQVLRSCSWCWPRNRAGSNAHSAGTGCRRTEGAIT